MSFLVGVLLGVITLWGGLYASSQEWIVSNDVLKQEVKLAPQMVPQPKEVVKGTTSTIPNSASTSAATTTPPKEPPQEKPAEEKPTPPQEPKEVPQGPVTSCEGHQEGTVCVTFSAGANAQGICRPGDDGALMCVIQ